MRGRESERTKKGLEVSSNHLSFPLSTLNFGSKHFSLFLHSLVLYLLSDERIFVASFLRNNNKRA